MEGARTILYRGSAEYPAAFDHISNPPKQLFVVGDVAALQEGIAIVGARNSTPYGRGCARRFARLAAEHGIVVISGGARGCDAQAHQAALEVGGRTVVFLGGGYDRPYPSEHAGLFKKIAQAGGAVVSEYPWDEDPRPYRFRARNRLIAGLARATLIVEAGLPSGTFSTADEALAANRDVLVVPGAITSPSSSGSNRLLYQGATPIVDDETFIEELFALFGCLRQECMTEQPGKGSSSLSKGNKKIDPIIAALLAQPLGMEDLFNLAVQHCAGSEPRAWLMERLVDGETAGLIGRFPDGRWGPCGEAHGE